MKRMQLLLGMLALMTSITAVAEEIIMARVARPFPEAISMLQDSIRARGYTVSRIQRVDVGLTSSGFQTAEYRLVFFGKEQEIRNLPARALELVPFLPLNIVIYAEGDDTLVLTTNPVKLPELSGHPELADLFRRWEQDVRGIFKDLTD